MMPTQQGQMVANEGLYRFSGMYGMAYRDGKWLMDVQAVAGTVEIARVDVPLAGRDRLGYKPGRQHREGTLRISKLDTAWELEVYNFISLTLDERRANRNAGKPSLIPWSIVLKIDDPDALGAESMQLNGCLLWRMNIGYDITQDLLEREVPFTWENEVFLNAFKRGTDNNGNPVAIPQVV